MSENNENACPTCGATGTNPCLTKSGSAAKKMHATRKIAATVEAVRETAKQRFDRFKAERKAREKRERESPTFNKPVGNRESRRSNGMYKTVHRGAMRRRKRLNANAEVRAFWHPEPEAVSTDSE
jgi:hypothetical protein